MAKGKTNQPLVIWVDEEYEHTPPVQSLEAQGHHVYVLSVADKTPPEKADLILHPAAHQWNEYMWEYLPAAIAAARKRKRGAKG